MDQVTTNDGQVLVPAAYAVVVQHLRRAIHLGTYAPGEKLPPEREHAELLGVSRVTLREALRVLEGEGYLQMRRGSAGGAIVSGPPASPGRSSEYLREHLDEILALQEFRQAIEPLSAARAAERRTPEALDRLRKSVDDLRQATTLGLFRRADTNFHLTLADSADCPPPAASDRGCPGRDVRPARRARLRHRRRQRDRGPHRDRRVRRRR